MKINVIILVVIVMEKSKYRYTWKGFFGHLSVITKHRFKVFVLCAKVGIFWRGLVHDLSKYSPVEFLEGVKYFDGGKSPIMNCKKEEGYSKAWLHHKGRNKHHLEYWYDYAAFNKTPNMPFKYFLEHICDNFAAGMIYQGKKWTKEYQLTYWNKTKDKIICSDNMRKLLTRVFTDVSIKGLDPVLTRSNLKKLYNEYMEK